jgi:hypothetical protein
LRHLRETLSRIIAALAHASFPLPANPAIAEHQGSDEIPCYRPARKYHEYLIPGLTGIQPSQQTSLFRTPLDAGPPL